ncbi:MAG TPA: hypothetical protein PKW30_07040 [Campylobacterales bacterium]|nr:hypothetical protein [Campylobacterales bacterium]
MPATASITKIPLLMLARLLSAPFTSTLDKNTDKTVIPNLLFLLFYPLLATLATKMK